MTICICPICGEPGGHTVLSECPHSLSGREPNELELQAANFFNVVVFTIGITAEQHEILKKQAEACNIRVSDVIRQLIEDHRIWD